MLASRRGHFEIVETLLEEGADPDLQDAFGSTALMLASFWNKVDVVRLLCENRADATLHENHRGRHPGRTALMNAASKDHTEVVKLLLECTDTAYTVDENGNTALSLAQPRAAIVLLLHGVESDTLKAAETAISTAAALAQTARRLITFDAEQAQRCAPVEITRREAGGARAGRGVRARERGARITLDHIIGSSRDAQGGLMVFTKRVVA